MTGYGRGECEQDGRLFTVEIKTVNHRYFEPSIRLSRKLAPFEGYLRGILKEKIARGKTDVYVNYENHSEEQGEVWINSARLAEYLTALRREGEKYGLKDDLTLSRVLQMPEVMATQEAQEDEERLKEMLTTATNRALDALNTMREREGENLKADLLEKIDHLAESQQTIAARAPYVVADYKEKLYGRIREYLDPEIRTEADSSRLEQEITLFSDKCCIDEELTRLASHFVQFRQILQQQGPVGRNLDFLTQELNRETNTIASKSNDLEITREALKMKNEIEKIREQIQNLE
jgi:uncharacterized protein (TIGR00255 family)